MLSYTKQIITFDNINFKVLDVENINFSQAKVGVKKQLTKVVCAKGGEKIVTKNNKAEIENITIAQTGDAIFCNNKNDKYIPSTNGKTWKFDSLQSYGYEIVKTLKNCVYVKSTNKALLLVEIINQPSCIQNAFGNNKHQFLYKGATLKKDIKTGKVTGIDKHAFDTTWEVF